MRTYSDAAHEAYARLVAAREMPRAFEDDAAKTKRQKRERDNAMIRRGLPGVT